MDTLLSAGSNNINSVNIGQLRNAKAEFEKQKSLFDEKAYVPREKIAIDLVMRGREYSTEKFTFLVYGNAHDYTHAVEEWNKKKKEKIGLLRNLIEY